MCLRQLVYFFIKYGLIQHIIETCGRTGRRAEELHRRTPLRTTPVACYKE